MQSDYSKNVKKLEKIFGIKISNPKLFEKALTHSSYTRENDLSITENYERLEFLGDAVLKLCMSEILYKQYENYAEGELTKIRSIVVSDTTLAAIAEKIGVSELIILGKQEEKTGGRDRKSILACAFESILGAYFLENKYNKISEFLQKVLEENITDVDKNFEKFNAKAVLQEYTQSINKTTPVYAVIQEKGPEHDKIFSVEVSFNNEVVAQGSGKTKKEAEQDAAFKACKKLIHK